MPLFTQSSFFRRARVQTSARKTPSKRGKAQSAPRIKPARPVKAGKVRTPHFAGIPRVDAEWLRLIPKINREAPKLLQTIARFDETMRKFKERIWEANWRRDGKTAKAMTVMAEEAAGQKEAFDRNIGKHAILLQLAGKDLRGLWKFLLASRANNIISAQGAELIRSVQAAEKALENLRAPFADQAMELSAKTVNGDKITWFQLTPAKTSSHRLMYDSNNGFIPKLPKWKWDQAAQTILGHKPRHGDSLWLSAKDHVWLLSTGRVPQDLRVSKRPEIFGIASRQAITSWRPQIRVSFTGKGNGRGFWVVEHATASGPYHKLLATNLLRMGWGFS